MPPDEPNEEERQEELPQDNQTPFQPADPPRNDSLPADSQGQPGGSSALPVDDTHPVTDTDVDKQELYDAGTAEATGASEPNSGNDVTGYTKPDENNENNP